MLVYPNNWEGYRSNDVTYQMFTLGPEYYETGNPGGFNAGFFICVNKNLTTLTVERILKYHAQHIRPGRMLEQRVMNLFLNNYRGEYKLLMGPYYNDCLKRICRRPDSDRVLENVSVIHFVGYKPWIKKEHPVYRKLDQLWMDYFLFVSQMYFHTFDWSNCVFRDDVVITKDASINLNNKTQAVCDFVVITSKNQLDYIDQRDENVEAHRLSFPLFSTERKHPVPLKTSKQLWIANTLVNMGIDNAEYYSNIPVIDIVTSTFHNKGDNVPLVISDEEFEMNQYVHSGNSIIIYLQNDTSCYFETTGHCSIFLNNQTELCAGSCMELCCTTNSKGESSIFTRELNDDTWVHRGIFRAYDFLQVVSSSKTLHFNQLVCSSTPSTHHLTSPE